MNLTELFMALEQGATLITVNNRLAGYYRRQFDQRMASNGRIVWKSPDIQPMQRWLQQQAAVLRSLSNDQRQILSPHEERQVWIKIIEPDAYETYMMPASMIATQVMQAAQLIQQWQIPLASLTEFDSPEAFAIQHWFSQFERQSRQQGWLTNTQLLQHISQAIGNQTLPVNNPIMIAGFQDPNKLHQKLFENLNRECPSLHEIQPDPINQSASLAQCRDLDDEIEQASQWAKNCLLKGGKTIGVVIPALAEQRQRVNEIFTRHLHPERLQEFPPFKLKHLFEISLGQNLLDLPLVSDALLALQLLLKEIKLQTLNRLLTATYLSGESFNLNDQTAAVDSMLRNHGRHHWTLQALINYLEHQQSVGTEVLLTRLRSLQQLLSEQPRQQSLFAWTGVFFKTWEILGWPGQRTLSSDEYQQHKRLLTLMEDFRHLHSIHPKVELSSAIALLRQVAAEAVYQSQSPATPIQVMGLLEAADQQFDHLWISGLDDRTLPAATAPNAFIPLSLQRQYQVPHCSADRELKFADNLLQSFYRNSRELIISHVEIDQDMEMRPSPLLQRLPLQPLTAGATPAASDALPIKLEILNDPSVQALAPATPVRGGAGILTAQASCPFRAAVAFRLNARALEEQTEGISPIDRGNQVHRIMELLWKSLSNRQTLDVTDEQTLKSLIDDCIDKVLTSYRYQRPDLYTSTFLSLEKQQLHKITRNWLEFEKQRTQPFEVAEMETQQQIEIGGIVLTVKADRIDQLANGQRLILDYKTGYSASSKSWLEDSIAEPQLPLYSLLENDQLGGLALAKIHEKQCSFHGISRDKDILPGVTPLPDKPDQTAEQQWQALRNNWRVQLNTLGESFRQGDARLNTLNCQFCDYEKICRKNSTTLTNAELAS